MKGLAGILIFAIIMVGVTVIGALFAFGTKTIIDKRILQEKILTEGNRLELTGKSLIMASDLATLQAINDISYSYVTTLDNSINTCKYSFELSRCVGYCPKGKCELIAPETCDCSNFCKYSFELSRCVGYCPKGKCELIAPETCDCSLTISPIIKYNPEEKLPYWDDVPWDNLKKNIEILSKAYFRDYYNGYLNFFTNPDTSQGRYKYWNLVWDENSKFESFNNIISINFGNVIINYNEGPIHISKEFPIKSNINTDFIKILYISEYVISDLKNNEDLSAIKEKIKSNYPEIEAILEDKGEYVKIYIYVKNEKYLLYDIATNSKKESNMGVKFLFDKGYAPKIDLIDLSNIIICNNNIVIMSNNNICHLLCYDNSC